VSELLRKWNEAGRMSRELKLDWEEFDKSISSDLTSPWSTLITTPYQSKGKWTSVFLLPETAGE
jgi:hypothetical protein